MARPNKEFLLAWNSLADQDVKFGWRTIAIDSAGQVEIAVGRRFPGNEEAMLVRFAKASITANQKLPNGQGFSVERVEEIKDGSTRLALTRSANGSLDLFLAMVCNVVDALDDAADVNDDQANQLRVFLRRVLAWQEFMRKGAQPLGAEAEIGLFGELVVLEALIEAGLPPHDALYSWLGPLDGLQDFEIGTGAIEVKTTVADTGFIAKIGSLDQLNDAVRKPLYLAAVRLKQAASGRTLPDLVASLKSTVSSDQDTRMLLTDKLIAAGYFDGQQHEYIRRLQLNEIFVHEVAPGFPRLIRGAVPIAVTRATYEIDLEIAPGLTTDIPTALKTLGAL